MNRFDRTPSGTERWQPVSSGRAAWRDAGGLVPILAAIALWVSVVVHVLAPLGAALASAGAPAPAVATLECPAPPGALASAERTRAAAECP